MPEPKTMATVAVEVVSTGAESTAVAAAVAGGYEGVGGLAAGSDVAGTIGKTTEAFIDLLKREAPDVAEAMLSRAPASGAELARALNKFEDVGHETDTIKQSTETLSSGSECFDLSVWTGYSPETGAYIGPETVHGRFLPLHERANLETFIHGVQQSDAGFRQEMERRTQQLREARTPADREAALKQLRKGTSGKLGEVITIDSFKPFFEKFEVQRRVETPSGRTDIDIRFTGARNPLALGRGHGVPEGGNLSIEVKTGQSTYLEREVTHITERQVPGHLELGDRSLVVVSRDFYAMEGERAARAAVGEAGSYVMAILPLKRVMDEALVRVIRESINRS